MLLRIRAFSLQRQNGTEVPGQGYGLGAILGRTRANPHPGPTIARIAAIPRVAANDGPSRRMAKRTTPIHTRQVIG